MNKDEEFHLSINKDKPKDNYVTVTLDEDPQNSSARLTQKYDLFQKERCQGFQYDLIVEFRVQEEEIKAVSAACSEIEVKMTSIKFFLSFKLKNFGGRNPEDFFPFFQFFSPDFQFSPLILHTFGYLHSSDLITMVQLTSKYFRKIVKGSSLVKQYEIEKITCEKLLPFLETYEIESVKIESLLKMGYLMVQKNRNLFLKEIKFVIPNKQGISENEFYNILRTFPNLEKLQLSMIVLKKEEPLPEEKFKNLLFLNIMEKCEFVKEFYLKLFEKCPNLSHMLIKDNFFDIPSTDLKELKSKLKKGTWYDFKDITIEVNKHYLLLSCGYVWDICYFVVGDNFYFFSMNNMVIQTCFKLEVEKGDIKRNIVNHLYKKSGSGFCCENLLFSPLSMKEKVERKDHNITNLDISFSVKVEKIFKDIQEFEKLENRRDIMKLDLPVSQHKLMKIDTQSFDNVNENITKYKQVVFMAGIEWLVEISYDRTEEVYTFYLYNYRDGKEVFYTNVHMVFSEGANLTKSSSYYFKPYGGWGWSSLRTKKKILDLSLTITVMKILSQKDYDLIVQSEKEKSKMMLTQTAITGKDETKEVEVHMNSYDNSVVTFFNALGIEWKSKLLRSMGKFSKPAFFLYPHFQAPFVIRLKFKLEILNSEFICETPFIDYCRGRGWGWDEITIPSSTDYIFKYTVHIDRIFTVKEYEDHVDKLAEKAIFNKVESILIKFNNKKGFTNAFQSNKFVLNGIPFLAHFYPIGVADSNYCSLFFYHLVDLHYKVEGHYTIKFQVGGKEVSVEKFDIHDEVRFEKLCKKDLERVWEVTLDFKLVNLKKESMF